VRNGLPSLLPRWVTNAVIVGRVPSHGVRREGCAMQLMRGAALLMFSDLWSGKGEESESPCMASFGRTSRVASPLQPGPLHCGPAALLQ